MKLIPALQHLSVWRTFSDGQKQQVGELAQNAGGIYFQYHTDYLAYAPSLSPFNLAFDNRLQVAPQIPHAGLHGVFADSLPDGWGMLLMDSVFRQQGVMPHQLTPLHRLAFVGQHGVGALSFEPCTHTPVSNESAITLSELGQQAQAVFAGQSSEVLVALAQAGGSGGARPKAQVYLKDDIAQHVSIQPQTGYQPWLVKFTAASLPLAHEEGVCEAAYLTLAQQAGIDVPAWQLIDAPTGKWLAVKRFDCVGEQGHLHLHSVAGLLDADFRTPSLDYENLIKLGCMLCQSPAVGQALFRRAVFNLFACNQDDHSKNWAFLQQDNGQWQLSPAYDITFSPSPYNEHSTAFMGYGKQPSLKAIQQLAAHANIDNWHKAQIIIHEILDALSNWASVAMRLGVSAQTTRMIQQQLDKTREENGSLWG
ncbi:MAG: type II toxin-antitoxin system HipA family toxin [Sulfuriferula sp.]|nr:type II toxin-antitoxin system HipA family toxin [Sulfuriferula sp.]